MPRPDSSVFWNNAFFKDLQGQEAIEYALMVGFVRVSTDPLTAEFSIPRANRHQGVWGDFWAFSGLTVSSAERLSASG
jgi:hypothetical protein